MSPPSSSLTDQVDMPLSCRILSAQIGDPDEDAPSAGVCSRSDSGLARDCQGIFGFLCYATSKGTSLF